MNDSSPLYDAAIQMLLNSLAPANKALTPARSGNS
jgi:hypothetical protein